MNPMFERDFAGFAEKKRFFVMRTAIVAAPVIGLIFLALVNRGRRPDELGSSIFAFTSYPLLVLSLLIAPSLLAHSIVIERQLNTLEVLRTTALTPWRIVWGKWSGRTLLLLLVCVAAMPLSASSLLFGGISTIQILQFALILFSSVLWATSLSVLVSCTAKDVTTSMRHSVLYVILGLVGTAVFAAFLAFMLQQLGVSSDYASGLLVLNPVAVLVFTQGGPIARGFPITFAHPAYIYSAVAVLLTSLFLLAATRIVAREGQKPFNSESTRAANGKPRRRWLPQLLDRAPAIWLEVNMVTGVRRLSARVLTVVVLSLIELGFVYTFFNSLRQRLGWLENAEYTWGIHAAAAGGFLFLSLLSVISLGAGAFRRDSDAKTLESLYATPLSSNELARGKISGVLFAASPGFLLAQFHALVAMLMLALNPIAWLWWVAASTVLLLSAAGFAMRIGIKSRSLLQANLLSMGAFGIWMVGLPIFIGMMLTVILSRRSGSDEIFMFLAMGWHPMWQALAPFYAGAPSSHYIRDANGWWIPLGYLAIYGAAAWYFLRHSIPTEFRRLREGDDSGRTIFK